MNTIQPVLTAGSLSSRNSKKRVAIGRILPEDIDPVSHTTKPLTCLAYFQDKTSEKTISNLPQVDHKPTALNSDAIQIECIESAPEANKVKLKTESETRSPKIRPFRNENAKPSNVILVR